MFCCNWLIQSLFLFLLFVCLRWHYTHRQPDVLAKNITHNIMTESTEKFKIMEDTDRKWISKCENISIPFCKNIGYKITTFPNLLRHQTQEEASLAIQQYSSAVITKCSPYLQLFLCSLYVPICTMMYDPIPPCQSLCLKVKRSCEDSLSSLHLKWPMDCNQFPENISCVNE